MAELKMYRTYRFFDKDPVIDEIRTLVRDEGLMKKLGIVHELSGVSTSTLENWFNGGTKSPQNRTICAVTSALGYKRTWEKTKDINLQKELKIAKAWNDQQRKAHEEAERRVAKRKPIKHREHRAAS
jgi:transcriptional regulator with XRE-family HTH domain